MEYSDYARNEEIISHRIEALCDGETIRIGVLEDTIKRLEENNKYLKERLCYADAQRFTKDGYLAD